MNVKLTIKEQNSGECILKLEDGKTIAWPTDRLPKNTKLGDVLTFKIYDDGSEKEPEQLAKDLLNEILNID